MFHCLLLCCIDNNNTFFPGTNSQMAPFIREKFALGITSNTVNNHAEAFESRPVRPEADSVAALLQ